MKGLALLGLLAGLGVVTLLVLSHGLGAIWHSAAVLGVGGFLVVVAVNLLLICLMGAGWWVLARGRPFAALPRFIWARTIRDSAAEALPLSQVGGFVFGARALALTGVPGAFAAGSTVVDVTAELVAQLAYTAIGLLLMERLRPNSFALPVLAGLALMSAAVAAFIALQARGAGLVERMGARLAREFLGRDVGGAGAVQAVIAELHARPRALLLATSLHLVTWLGSGVEAWLTLGLMGVPITLPAAIVIDSLLYGMRSVAFMVPNAVGVQEGGLVLLGGWFGVTPDASLALSLIRRARDLTVGVPALLAWQMLEGRQAWRKTGVAGPDAEGSIRV